MDVQFVASVAPIVRDTRAARAFYADALGLSFEGGEGEYRFTQELDGSKHVGLGRSRRRQQPASGRRNGRVRFQCRRPASSSRVADVAAAADELKAKGYRLIHEARTEPWKQITARLLSPEGLLVAVCYTPSFHDRSGVSS